MLDAPKIAAHADTFDLDAGSRRLVADLHAPKPGLFWADVLGSAIVGWTSFGVAVAARPFSTLQLSAVLVAAFALYRGLCFTHELTHLKRRSVPGLETAWNILFGVPLLLPSFTYVGVHQSHHSLSTYGTKNDPEYLPFAQSRRLIWVFSLQSALVLPLLLALRFLVMAPIGLVWPRFHRWLEAHASSFSMNPEDPREVGPEMAQRMRRWELVTLAVWVSFAAAIATGLLPGRSALVWYAVMAIVCFVNTLRVLGAHEYESDGAPGDRRFQLIDSIDTPGGPWTELWAPVGLRYHAVHHYFPGIPYHNLGVAYRRLAKDLPADSGYLDSTSPSLPVSLRKLYTRAKQRGAKILGR